MTEKWHDSLYNGGDFGSLLTDLSNSVFYMSF